MAPDKSPKWFLRSKSIWAAIVVVLPIIAPMFGINVTQDDASFVNEHVDKIISGVGALVMFFDRLLSSHRSLKAAPANPFKRR